VHISSMRARARGSNGLATPSPCRSRHTWCRYGCCAAREWRDAPIAANGVRGHDPWEQTTKGA
jgi:hypothetical protein